MAGGHSDRLVLEVAHLSGALGCYDGHLAVHDGACVVLDPVIDLIIITVPVDWPLKIGCVTVGHRRRNTE